MRAPALDVASPVHPQQRTVAARIRSAHAHIAARIGRRAAGADTWAQVRRFAAVGGLTTVVHLGLFATLRGSAGTSSQTANLVALLVATLVNTALNRRWTFGVRGSGAARHQLRGLVVFAGTWLMTASALGLLHAVSAAPTIALATAVLAVATAASTVVRFVAMRSWMFRSPQSSLSTKVPSASSNTTMPVQS